MTMDKTNMIKKIISILSICGMGLLGASGSVLGFVHVNHLPSTEKSFIKIIEKYDHLDCKKFNSDDECLRFSYLSRGQDLEKLFQYQYTFHHWVVRVLSIVPNTSTLKIFFTLPNTKMIIILQNSGAYFDPDSLDDNSRGALVTSKKGDLLEITGYFNPNNTTYIYTSNPTLYQEIHTPRFEFTQLDHIKKYAKSKK